MIWDKLSPFYVFFENVYNGKCYKGIAEKITEYVTDYSVGMLRQTKKKVAKYSNTEVRKTSILELPLSVYQCPNMRRGE